MDLLLVIIFIAIAISATSKKKKKPSNQQPDHARQQMPEQRTKNTKPMSNDFVENIHKAEHNFTERHQRPQKQTKPKKHPQTSINDKARQNISERDSRQKAERAASETHTKTMAEIIKEKEEELRHIGHEHEEIPEEKHLMKIVSDLMVKGPDTSIPNERDFIGEAMNTITNYHS